MRNATIKTLVALLVITVFASADQALLDPTDDAYISNLYPDTKYGGHELLAVGFNGGYLSTLVKFDLSSYSGATVNNAYVQTYIYFTDDEYSNVKIGRNIADWSESTVTWNNRPGFSGYISVPSVPSSGWWEIDVTSFVQEFIGGTYDNYGFRIGKGDSDYGYCLMYSKESIHESERPYLELNYDPVAVESESLGNIKASFR